MLTPSVLCPLPTCASWPLLTGSGGTGARGRPQSWSLSPCLRMIAPRSPLLVLRERGPISTATLVLVLRWCSCFCGRRGVVGFTCRGWFGCRGSDTACLRVQGASVLVWTRVHVSVPSFSPQGLVMEKTRFPSPGPESGKGALGCQLGVREARAAGRGPPAHRGLRRQTPLPLALPAKVGGSGGATGCTDEQLVLFSELWSPAPTLRVLDGAPPSS